MSKKLYEENNIQEIASAIREKNGAQNQYTVAQMPAAVRAIEAQPDLETLTATENGNYLPSAGKDGFSSVSVNVTSGEAVVQSLRVTQNGTYNPPSGVDGYAPIIVNVSGGGGVIWRDPLCVNWDFANPVNTQGNTSYTSSGSWVSSIDGWGVIYASIELVNGGIRLSRNGSGASWSNQGYLEQKYKINMTKALSARQVTMSAIIDGVLGYATGVINISSAGDKLSMTVNGVSVRFYNYGSEIAITFDIGETSHIIQAVKLETGNQQTLATQVNGVWVLNNSMDADTEYIKARNGMVYNS